MSQEKEQQLRQEIEARVRELSRIKHGEHPFVAGHTYVSYSGRVFDEAEVVALVHSALDFWLTSGPQAATFEKNLATYIGTRGSVLVNSGSSANLLAVSALTSSKLDRPLRAGDEVITAAAGFPTTVNPIFQVGATPVFVDVELGSYNATAAAVEEAITEKTRAIILAHTLGNPFDVEGIGKLARKHELYLIEDNCDALGATVNGRMTGTFGDMATLSFYPAHQMTMGEGGAIVYQNARLRPILESFRDWGRDYWCDPGKENTCGKRFGWQLGRLPAGYDHKYIYSHIGYNLKATDLQAAIGVEQLKKVPRFVEKRRENFARLREALLPYEDRLILPSWSSGTEPSWFGLPITIRPNAPFTKHDLVTYLEKHRIATRPVFCGNLTRQPAYQSCHFRTVGDLPNTDVIMSSTFFLGVYPGIDEARLAYMCEVITRFFENTVRSVAP